MQIDDFDWAAATIRIRGKGHRTDTMPLPTATGAAIATYLRSGRPRTASRAVFMRHRAPLWVPASPQVIRLAVRRAVDRCQLTTQIGGPHIFRHTIAQRLVTQGTSLKQIADLLRHRSLTSTAIYAKVDLPTLSRVAMRWPGRRL